MTLRDWAADSLDRFRTQPVRDAAAESALEFALGAIRRLDVPVMPQEVVWNREWDVLLVLDACRVDVFQEVAESDRFPWLTSSDVVSVRSVGSCSPEWMDRTFSPIFQGDMARAAYVTANPFSAKPAERLAFENRGTLPLQDDDFAHLEEVWRWGWEDDPLSTVPPHTVTDRAIDVWRRRDELGVDRMIVHYMQPHIPFRSRPEWFGTRENLDTFGEPDVEAGTDPWKKVRDDELPRDEFWEAYRDNLEWVLDDVELLLENLAGAVAITSDHGNGFGEYGKWSHPPDSPVPAVRNVPWSLVEGVDHETYEPVEPGRLTVEESGGIESRLEALGYV